MIQYEIEKIMIIPSYLAYKKNKYIRQGTKDSWERKRAFHDSLKDKEKE